jgi:monothiol glutaredoxin
MSNPTQPLQQQIQDEVQAHKILIYSKGTKEAPRCGFTVETMAFFDRYGYPYTLIDVLDAPEKRHTLTEMTNWPTLPKVFINGEFYGDTDILDEMAANGEIEPLLAETFGELGNAC